MTAISTFTGAGGLDLGCEAAGFATVAAVESNATARTTLLANRARYFPALIEDAIAEDIVDLNVPELMERAGVHRGEVALLHGGPPCTPFSKSGYWLAYKRAGEDPKASLLDNYVATLRQVRPQAFLMENVYGLAYRNQNRPVLERFLAGARDAGYALDLKILLAADYGVPQLRQRMFCVGLRRDLLDDKPSNWTFPWPDAEYAGPHERRPYDLTLPPHVTAGEALAGLPRKLNPPEPEEIVRGTFLDELRAVPPGDNYLYWTAERGHPKPRFKWRSRYWSFLLKLAPDRPSPTIQGQPGPWVGPFHWDNRRLRVAELRRLMTFPDDFEVTGDRMAQQLQLGNAVPPLLAEVVARAIAAELVRLGAVSRAAVAA